MQTVIDIREAKDTQSAEEKEHSSHPNEDVAKAAADEETCAVMLEVIQGEGGINIGTEDFIVGLRAFCDEEGLLFIADEVSTGMGRTGRMFACEDLETAAEFLAYARKGRKGCN